MSAIKEMLDGLIELTKDYVEIERENEGDNKEHMKGYESAMWDMRRVLEDRIKLIKVLEL